MHACPICHSRDQQAVQVVLLSTPAPSLDSYRAVAVPAAGQTQGCCSVKCRAVAKLLQGSIPCNCINGALQPFWFLSWRYCNILITDHCGRFQSLLGNVPQMFDSARHAELAQYSQRSLQAGRSFQTASSQGEEDLELGIKGSTDAVVDDTAVGSQRGRTSKAGLGRVGTPKNLTPHRAPPSGEGRTASQKSIKSIRGASHRSMGSSVSSKSLSVAAAGMFSLIITQPLLLCCASLGCYFLPSCAFTA